MSDEANQRRQGWKTLAMTLCVVAACVLGWTALRGAGRSEAPPEPKPDFAANRQKAADAAAAAAKEKQDACVAADPAQREAYAAHMKKREYWDAAAVVRDCAERLKSPDLLALVRDAEIKSHMADINNPKAPLRTKANSMQLLARDYPDVGTKYAQQAAALIARADKEDATAQAAAKRKQGVAIGMSKEDVLASSWGRPDKINSTHTAFGTREQWVYRERGSGYLYFENGVLTTIQN